jgi:tyrosinase
MPPQVLGAADDVSLTSNAAVEVPMGRGAVERDLAAGPERVHLRIEGVTGTRAAPLYGVYLNVPAGADPHDFPALRAGSFATFGLAETSRTDDQHDAEGLTAVFDITDLRDRLTEAGRWDDTRVEVRFSTEVPGSPTDDAGAATGPAPDLRARRVALMVE